MIKPSDITGVDEDLARRVIAAARTIAPCLDSLVDGVDEDAPKPKSDAIAILRGVAREGQSRGSRLVKSQRIGPASVEYTSADSWFSTDDRNSLRSLCAFVSSAGLPLGHFPAPSTAIAGLWPERYEN